MISFVGDVHGKIPDFLEILKSYSGKKVVQIGDLGLGFAGVTVPPLDPNHRFFAGNHDSPAEFAKHPNNMGRYGIWENVFFVSGAFSIDSHRRIPGRSWWADEQLGREEMEEALDLYLQTKPRVVATHDLPRCLYRQVLDRALPGEKAEILENATAILLNEMFLAHQPEWWIAGHFHVSYRFKRKGTKFVVLDELETFDLTDV